MQLIARRIGIAAALALGLGLAHGAAEAYPQFQLSTANSRCSLCHIAPAGGGLLNEYGRSESGDTISQFGGNGAFLYGAYEEPTWIKFGVDLRGAVLAKQQTDDPEYYAFPMQGDTYVYLKGGAFSLYAVGGPRAQVRTPRDNVLDRFGSDEYWLMWRPKTTGWYARAGRFLTPMGLRSQDHTSYVRRYLGLHSWEETYNLSVGNMTDESELHVTAFTPVPYDLMGNGSRASGGVVYWEKRLADDKAAVGAQVRAAFADVDRRYLAGGIGKYYFEGARTLVMGEVDVQLQQFDDVGDTRPQLAGYLGVSYWPKTGIMLGANLERFDEDMSVADLARDAGSLTLQWFPLAHWELMLIGKLEAQGGEYGDPTSLGMFQLHYYL
ncbi:MAG TPA: hypothetical protein VK698_28755 [Kofleriaceae bacterium]|nr:hypothetical protein [Kofleriaceae bacterium]